MIENFTAASGTLSYGKVFSSNLPLVLNDFRPVAQESVVASALLRYIFQAVSNGILR